MRRGTQLRVAGLLAAAAVGLAGCAGAQPGTAVTVGDTRVEVDALQRQVDDVLAYRDGAGLPDVRDRLPAITQEVLSADVVSTLTADALARTGLAVDDAAIDTQLASVDDSALTDDSLAFLTPDTLRSLVRTQLVVSQLGAQAWDGLAVTVDITSAPDRDAAQAKAQRMAAGEAESAAVLAEDTAAGLAAQGGLELSPGVAAELAGSPLFTAPAGSAVAFQYQQQWQVARVVTRTTDAAGPAAADAVSAAQADTDALYALGLTLLPDLAGDPAVVVSPRYGTWDPTQGQVVPADDVPRGIVVAPTTAP